MEKKETKPVKADQLYTFKATLIAGRISKKFHIENPVVSRTIEIKGNQTLKTLHYAIYDSVEFDDEHLYGFEIGGKKPGAKSATRYELRPPVGERGWWGEKMGRGVTQTKVSSLELKPKKKFFYEFDFGDEWWWELEVVSIQGEVPKGKYPRVIERVGENPPQYYAVDDEEGWE